MGEFSEDIIFEARNIQLTSIMGSPGGVGNPSIDYATSFPELAELSAFDTQGAPDDYEDGDGVLDATDSLESFLTDAVWWLMAAMVTVVTRADLAYYDEGVDGNNNGLLDVEGDNLPGAWR